jgi:hypothetical protein
VDTMTDIDDALESLVEPVSLSPIVEEFRVWTLTDRQGSWAALIDDPHSSQRWVRADLWEACPTREEALRALWEAQQELRATGRDRRKQDRRHHARSVPDRRMALDGLAWAPMP